ncbi:MAG: ABC transporter substrate-binding protein [Erysipelotrichaceae bacterium]|jgi:multiple sugar transport system substrate-binding protein|nr:ABC transporter substrate-binding protein [Erysipelotrichaceae bacterium]
MKKLLLLIVSLLLLVSCGNSGSSSGSSGPVEVVIWHTLTEHHVENLQAIIDDFNAAHEGEIVVVAQAQPLENFDAKVIQAVRNGEGPDIIFSYPSLASEFVLDDLLVNLTPYIEDPDTGIPDFYDELTSGVVAEVSQWDGNIYLIPIIKTGEILFYNKTLFDELGLSEPKTWSDLEAAAKVISEHTGKPAFGFDSLTDGATAMIIQSGATYLDADTKTVGFNSAAAAAALQKYADGVQAGYFRLVGEDQYFSNPFGSEAVAMYIGSSAGVDFVLSAVDGKFEVGYAPLPQEGPVKYANSWGTSAIIFKSDAATEAAAFQFVKYFTSTEVNAKWAIGYGAITPYKSAQELDSFKEYVEAKPVIGVLVESLKNVGYVPSLPGSTEVRNELGKAAEQACGGLMDAQTALDQAKEAADSALSQY